MEEELRMRTKKGETKLYTKMLGEHCAQKQISRNDKKSHNF